MPMTQEEFYPPYERLTLAFNRLAFLSERERAILTEDWFQSFKRYSPESWERAVDAWKRSKTAFPTQAEMHDLLLDLIPEMVREEEEAARRERLAGLPPPDPERVEAVKANLRSWRRARQLLGPGPAPTAAPRLTDGDD